MDSLGGRLRKLREEKGLTQMQAADKLGIGNNSLSRYESDDRKPNPKMLMKLAELYETNGNYILGLTNDPSPDAPPVAVISERDKMSLKEIQEKIEKGLISDDLSEQDRAALIRYIEFLRNS